MISQNYSKPESNSKFSCATNKSLNNIPNLSFRIYKQQTYLQKNVLLCFYFFLCFAGRETLFFCFFCIFLALCSCLCFSRPAAFSFLLFLAKIIISFKTDPRHFFKNVYSTISENLSKNITHPPVRAKKHKRVY